MESILLLSSRCFSPAGENSYGAFLALVEGIEMFFLLVLVVLLWVEHKVTLKLLCLTAAFAITPFLIWWMLHGVGGWVMLGALIPFMGTLTAIMMLLVAASPLPRLQDNLTPLRFIWSERLSYGLNLGAVLAFVEVVVSFNCAHQTPVGLFALLGTLGYVAIAAHALMSFATRVNISQGD
jgi:hypothetical protein